MSEDASTRHACIDAAELNRVDVSADGTRLCLRLRDRDGRPASVSLPAECLNAVIAAVPGADPALSHAGKIHRLDGWSLGRTGDELVLTLQLPNGGRISVAVKPWQIAAIASLAGQDAGPHASPGRGRVH